VAFEYFQLLSLFCFISLRLYPNMLKDLISVVNFFDFGFIFIIFPSLKNDNTDSQWLPYNISHNSFILGYSALKNSLSLLIFIIISIGIFFLGSFLGRKFKQQIKKLFYWNCLIDVLHMTFTNFFLNSLIQFSLVYLFRVILK